MFDSINVDNIKGFMLDIESKRKNMSVNEWKSYVTSDNTLNRWRYFLSHDAYTRWGLIKPRGYAGDATLMDFAYKHESIIQHIHNSGELGQEIFKYTSSARQSESARKRTKHIAGIITELSNNATNLKIASYASGHGRELELLSSDTRANISKFVAIDSDHESLNILSNIKRDLTSVHKNVFRVWIKDYGSFDFIYSLGLFDYLSDQHAMRLINKMWMGLKPNGKLLIANLNYNAANIGYCEAIMDWWMIQRSEDELLLLTEHLNGYGDVQNISVETIGCFSYLSATKD